MLLALSTSMRLMQWVAQEGEYPVIQPVFNVSDIQFKVCVCGQSNS